MGPLPQAQVRTRSGRSETARCTRIAPQSWPTRSTGAPARSISRTSQSTYASLVASKPDERAAARERGALLRGERGQLARPRPCGPVRVGLRRRDLLDAPFDAHLPPEAIPVEGDGRARARAELAALAAAAVGEEDEAAAVGGLQEDEADRGRAPTPGGGERHRLSERDTGARGGPEPAAEAREQLGQGTYSTPQEKTRAGVTSTITTSDSSSAASSGYCGYFA